MLASNKRNADLWERLAYAWQEVEYIRRRLLELKPALRTGEPGQRPPGTLMAVTVAELQVAVDQLRAVRPLPLS